MLKAGSTSGLSLREALFLANLPYRQSFYANGGWRRTKGPGSAEWNSFLKNYFAAAELKRAEIESQDHSGSLNLKLAGRYLAIRALSFWDADYPQALAHIYDPPPVLFCWGDPCFHYRQYLAIVGTRRASPLCESAVDLFIEQKKYEQQKQSTASGSPKEELAIVSGLANGVDSLAHRAAIAHALGGIAVLGAGFFYAGPRRNLSIIQEAWKKGVPFSLLSEFSPRTPAYPHHFPRRNRIIAGLSQTLALIQAPKRSGALITARYALEEGRDILVFDHPLFDEAPGSNEGGRRLLENGAEKIILPKLENKLLQRPKESYNADPQQLSFWKKQLEGTKWLGGKYYLRGK